MFIVGTPESDRVLFKEEFDTMTRIGYHPNVVNILGSCEHQGKIDKIKGHRSIFIRKNNQLPLYIFMTWHISGNLSPKSKSC